MARPAARCWTGPRLWAARAWPVGAAAGAPLQPGQAAARPVGAGSGRQLRASGAGPGGRCRARRRARASSRPPSQRRPNSRTRATTPPCAQGARPSRRPHGMPARPPRPRIARDRMVLYEVHVRSLTMRHPAIEPALRGSYAALAHPAMLAHYRELGITTLNLLPVHFRADEAALQLRGLSNHWGYSPIAWLAPETRYWSGRPGTSPAGEFRRHGRHPARRGDRGGARCGVQPHRRDRRIRTDPVAARAGQCALLPPRARESCARSELDRLRQQRQAGRAARGGTGRRRPAPLGHALRRGRLPLRSRKSRLGAIATATSTATPASSPRCRPTRSLRT